MYALVTGVQTCALPIYGSAPRSIHHQVQSAVHKQLVAWINDDCRAIRCDFINAVAINKQREYALRKRRVGARHPSHRIMYSLFPCPCRGLSDHWNLPDNRGADSVNLEKVRENLRLVGFKLALAAKQFEHCGNVDFEGCGNILVGKP